MQRHKIYRMSCWIIFAIFSNPSAAGPTSLHLTISERAQHILSRMAFGPRPGDVERLVKSGESGIQKWIEEQMTPGTIDDSHLDHFLASLTALKMSGSEAVQAFPKPKNEAKRLGFTPEQWSDPKMRKQIRERMGQERLPNHLMGELLTAKLARATESNRQFQEVLRDFWFNHFNVDHSKGIVRWLIVDYEREAIAPHMFGRFADLLRATAHHPAMLFYLDNNLSESPLDYFSQNKPRKKGLNENYARELLELHTMGVDGGYTQEDVTQLARILTGWGIDQPNQNPRFAFHERVHDFGQKKFLEQNFPAGVGQSEGEKVLELLAQHPATAKFISFQLARAFVSDNPPASLVEKMKNRFLDSRGDLRMVYRELFSSPEFWSRTAFQAKVKKPFVFVVSAIRALGG